MGKPIEQQQITMKLAGVTARHWKPSAYGQIEYLQVEVRQRRKARGRHLEPDAWRLYEAPAFRGKAHVTFVRPAQAPK